MFLSIRLLYFKSARKANRFVKFFEKTITRNKTQEQAQTLYHSRPQQIKRNKGAGLAAFMIKCGNIGRASHKTFIKGSCFYKSLLFRKLPQTALSRRAVEQKCKSPTSKTMRKTRLLRRNRPKTEGGYWSEQHLMSYNVKNLRTFANTSLSMFSDTFFRFA